MNYNINPYQQPQRWHTQGRQVYARNNNLQCPNQNFPRVWYPQQIGPNFQQQTTWYAPDYMYHQNTEYQKNIQHPSYNQERYQERYNAGPSQYKWSRPANKKSEKTIKEKLNDGNKKKLEHNNINKGLKKVQETAKASNVTPQSSKAEWTQNYWKKGANVEADSETTEGQNNAQAVISQNLQPKGRIDNLMVGLTTPVDASKAERMMKMMGWQGGGLGTKGKGIEEPLMPALNHVKGKGLGHIDLPSPMPPKPKQPRQKPQQLPLQQFTYQSKKKTTRVVYKMPSTKPKKIKGSKRKRQISQIVDFKSLMINKLLQFVVNKKEHVLKFDSTMTKKERAFVHHVVETVRDPETALEIDYDSMYQMELVEQIRSISEYVLTSESEGVPPNRCLYVYKEAPEHVYLITKDDLSNDLGKSHHKSTNDKNLNSGDEGDGDDDYEHNNIDATTELNAKIQNVCKVQNSKSNEGLNVVQIIDLTLDESDNATLTNADDVKPKNAQIKTVKTVTATNSDVAQENMRINVLNNEEINKEEKETSLVNDDDLLMEATKTATTCVSKDITNESVSSLDSNIETRLVTEIVGTKKTEPLLQDPDNMRISIVSIGEINKHEVDLILSTSEETSLINADDIQMDPIKTTTTFISKDITKDSLSNLNSNIDSKNINENIGANKIEPLIEEKEKYITRALLKYFKEFCDDTKYTELKVLGNFDDKESKILKSFFTKVKESIDGECSGAFEKVVEWWNDVFDNKDFSLNLIEDGDVVRIEKLYHSAAGSCDLK